MIITPEEWDKRDYYHDLLQHFVIMHVRTSILERNQLYLRYYNFPSICTTDVMPEGFLVNPSFLRFAKSEEEVEWLFNHEVSPWNGWSPGVPANAYFGMESSYPVSFDISHRHRDYLLALKEKYPIILTPDELYEQELRGNFIMVFDREQRFVARAHLYFSFCHGFAVMILYKTEPFEIVGPMAAPIDDYGKTWIAAPDNGGHACEVPKLSDLPEPPGEE